MRISDWSSDVCSSDLAQAKIAQVKLPAGYYLEWGGQFENLAAASKRLSIVVPLCFLVSFGLLYMALGGFGRAAAVFLAVPLGLAGGVLTLVLTGSNFSVSAEEGFIRSEEHTSELQSLMRISYDVLCLKKKTK